MQIGRGSAMQVGAGRSLRERSESVPSRQGPAGPTVTVLVRAAARRIVHRSCGRPLEMKTAWRSGRPPRRPSGAAGHAGGRRYFHKNQPSPCGRPLGMKTDCHSERPQPRRISPPGGRTCACGRQEILSPQAKNDRARGAGRAAAAACGPVPIRFAHGRLARPLRLRWGQVVVHSARFSASNLPGAHARRRRAEARTTSARPG
jgi:hypothetical protein